MRHYISPTSIRKRVAMLLISAVALCGCMRDVRHLSFISTTSEGWIGGDTLIYIIDTLETAKECGVELLLHTEGYSYANIGFHISIVQDSITLYADSISTYLKESNPARGIARRCDYTIPITNLTLADSTHTTIEIMHLMEESPLKGIREIGIRIGSPVRRPGEVVWQVEW